MEGNSNLEERFKLVMELNEVLEELNSLKQKLISIKIENAQLMHKNKNNNFVDLNKIQTEWKDSKAKNEFLLKESQILDDSINQLKNELNDFTGD